MNKSLHRVFLTLICMGCYEKLLALTHIAQGCFHEFSNVHITDTPVKVKFVDYSYLYYITLFNKLGAFE